MKNLKKILIAALAMAVLITTVVVTALAASGGSYTGDVTTADSLLQAALSAATADEKSESLKVFKQYFDTVDPEAEGYASLAATYNATTLALGQEILAVNHGADPADYETRMLSAAALYKHINGAPIAEDAADETTVNRWEVLKRNYDEKAFALTSELIDMVEEQKTPENVQGFYDFMQDVPMIDKGYEGYGDFVKRYNTANVEVLNMALTMIPETPEALEEVLEFHALTPLVSDAVTDAVAESYETFKTAFDALTIKVANTMLTAIVDTDPYKENAAKLADVYELIDDVPLFNNDVEAYTSLEKAVSVKSLAIAKLYYGAVEELVGNEETEVTPEFAKAVTELLAFLKNCPTIIYRQTPIGPATGKLEDAKALFDAIDFESETVVDNFAALYVFMHKTPVDPAAEGAAEFYEDYEKLVSDMSAIVIEAMGYLDSNPTLPGTEDLDVSALSENLANLQLMADLLIKAPVSLEAVTAYNQILNGFTATLKKNFDSKFGAFTGVKGELDSFLEDCPIDPEILPENSGYEEFMASVKALESYNAIKSATDKIYDPAKPETSVDTNRAALADALNNILAAALLDYDKLTDVKPGTGVGSVQTVQGMMVEFNDTASGAAKAEKYAEIYAYLRENPINPKSDGYDLFYADFAVAADEVYEYLVSRMSDTAQMAEVYEYLSVTPISELAIETYNMKYLFVFREALTTSFKSYQTAMNSMHKYIADSGFEDVIESTEGLTEALDNYEILELTALVQLYNLLYLDDDMTTNHISVVDRGQSIKQIKTYVADYPISDSVVGASIIKEEVAAAVNDYQTMLAAARDALDKQTPFEEYDFSAYDFVADFDNQVITPFTAAHVDNRTGNNTGSRYDFVPGPDGNGYCMKVTYSSFTSPFFTITKMSTENDVVIEFDISADTVLSGFNFNRIEGPSSAREEKSFFRINNNKFYPCVDGAAGAAWKNKEIITPGEWTKIIAVYHHDEQQMSAWIDYEYVGTWSVKMKNYTSYTETRISIGANTVTYIDNFNVYTGTNYRIKDKFTSMTDAEKFCYFVDYMCDETLDPTARLAGYQKAALLFPKFENDAELAAYVEKYKSLDPDKDIVGPAKDANLALLEEHAKALAPYSDLSKITTENIPEVLAAIETIESFVSVNSAYLDQASTRFTSIISNVNALKLQISRCQSLVSFTQALKQFDRAFTVAAKTRHLDTATGIYDEAEFRDAEIRAALAFDPAALAFEQLINGELASTDPNYITVFEYYDYCDEIIAELQLSENSVKIIDCLGFITSLPGYEDTEEFWAENYDYISAYMNIIRSYVKAYNYDPAYEGIQEAIAKFETIDVYFNTLLKELHVKELKDLIARYASATTYIEKLGVCTSITNYIINNNVDTSNTQVQQIIATNESYMNELKDYELEYAAILVQNTQYFINATNKMDSYVDYNNLRALCDEALKYYYEMNVDSEAAQAAIAKFEACRDKVEAMEEASKLLKGYVNELSAAKTDANVYKALVKCAPYIDKVSEDIDGVSAALAKYNEKLNAYNAKYIPCNNEIAEVNAVVCSVRTNVIAQAVLAVIGAIFNK